MSLTAGGQSRADELPAAREWPITLAELERAVRSADRAALWVLPRILRRVIKHDRQLPGWGLTVPHRKSYVIARQRLLAIADPSDLDVGPDFLFPEQVLLLARPDPDRLAALTAGEALVYAWRLLFHARVHADLERAAAEGRLGPDAVRQRAIELGAVPLDEIRAVLHQEGFLLPPRDAWQVYVEFAAVYLELRYFAPSLIGCYFPALESPAAAEQILAQDLDAEALFHATRPTGAPDPIDHAAVEEWADPLAEEATLACRAEPDAGGAPGARLGGLLRRADRAAAVGNIVRSLILQTRALPHASGGPAARLHVAIRDGVERLVARLHRALDLPRAELPAWRQSLAALVQRTASGIWPPESRLLYDLQKACVDSERGVYTIDLVEWALSLGRRPIKRALPRQRDALVSKHLRSAAARLPAVRLSAARRVQVSALLRAARDQAERRLRERFRPLLSAALDAVGLCPANVPERVARHKIVESLLDVIAQRGFLRMSDLRDALSVNNLKLPDFTAAIDLLRGDQLLRADRRLAGALDGVYHRGDFYLRWMQQLSCLGFGTGVGRFLTRYVVVPFGGSYVAVAGVKHFAELISGTELEIEVWSAALPLGLFLLGLVNVGAFRRGVWELVKRTVRAARTLLVEPLLALVRSPLVQQVWHSRAFALLTRFVLRPLLFTSAAYWLTPLELAWSPASLGTAAGVFVAINLAVNSRLGRTVEEVLADWIVQGWHRFGLRLLSGMFWLVIDLFKALLENIERLLYTVDEWLRFRTGETFLSFTAKALLGLVWFFLSFVIRFGVNLLIEPQVNPIKHVPVVTVSHKLLLPFIPTLGRLLALTMDAGLAYTIASAIIVCIPGIFGFLVWELQENWRLYAANRRPYLGPVPVGSHRETMPRLLRPGFHSGTLPKRFAKLRRAERKARASGRWLAVRKHLHVLEHIQRDVRRYCERELVALLAEVPGWNRTPLRVENVWLATNRVHFSLACPPPLGPPLEVAFELESGRLRAGIVLPGWLSSVEPAQRQLVANALAGLYVTAGTELSPTAIAWQDWCQAWDAALDADAAIWPILNHE